MYMTEQDLIICDVVRRMGNMTNAEIADYLTRCKGINIEPEWVQLYRPAA